MRNFAILTLVVCHGYLAADAREIASKSTFDCFVIIFLDL